MIDTYRNPAVAAEIAALPAVADPAYLPAALAAQAPETACQAIRLLLARGDTPAAQQVGTHLIALVSARLLKIARHYFPYQPDLQEELAQELAVQVWATVADLRPCHDFLCCNFWVAVNRDTSHLAAKAYRRVGVERPFATDPKTGASAAETLPAPAADPGELLIAADLLAALTPRERTVAVGLAQGFTSTEIAAQLKMTDRNVRFIRARMAARLTAAGLSPAAAPWAGLIDRLTQLWHQAARLAWPGPAAGGAT